MRKTANLGTEIQFFKHDLYEKCFVTAIGLKLPKRWTPKNQYGPLQNIPENELSPNAIFERVCQVRMEKLPDPAKVGNAGSFFKKPCDQPRSL